MNPNTSATLFQKSLFAVALASAPLSAMAVAYSPMPTFSPMYATTHTGINDNLYTMDYAEAYSSTTNHGYTGLGTAFYLERTPQTQTKPLYRYYRGAPQTEHFYFTDTYPEDRTTAINLGYAYEGIAGYLYTVQVPGSMPLHRLSKINAATQDRVHRFTVSAKEMNTLIGSGWTYDHVEGYVPQTTSYYNGGAFISGFPYLANGHIMTRRCQQTPLQNNVCTGATFRNGYVGYRFVDSTSRKLASQTTQVMEFDLLTPDYMTAAQNDHIAIGLHGRWNIDLANIDNVSNPARNHHALGITIGDTGCGVTVRVEAFWPTGNNLPGCSAQGILQNNTTYHFRISVSDSGTIQYVVTRPGTSFPVASGVYNGATLFTNPLYPFPSTETGYFIVSSTTATVDYTVYMSNLSVYWQ